MQLLFNILYVKVKMFTEQMWLLGIFNEITGV